MLQDFILLLMLKGRSKVQRALDLKLRDWRVAEIQRGCNHVAALMIQIKRNPLMLTTPTSGSSTNQLPSNSSAGETEQKLHDRKDKTEFFEGN